MVKISIKTVRKALKIDVKTDSEQIVDDVVKLESNEAEKNVSEISNIVNDISEDNVSTPPDSDRFSSIVDDYRQTDIDGIGGEMSMLEDSLY